MENRIEFPNFRISRFNKLLLWEVANNPRGNIGMRAVDLYVTVCQSV